MRVCDSMCRAKGFVSPSFIDISTGKRIPYRMRCNKLSYMSAEAMAAAFGGDPSYIPAKVGFIYGNQSVMPSESPITRSQSWDDLERELDAGRGEATVDVQVVPFSYSPTLGGEKRSNAPGSSSGGSDSSSSQEAGGEGYGEDYCNIIPTGSNAITFHAVSNSQDPGAMFGSDAFINGNYVYQAILLGFHQGRNYILSRVSLKDGDRYLPKPDGFEVALDWTIVFH